VRIGHGYDVHAFGPGDHVVLGGEHISHSQGLIAHSDGDVVLHALSDALLGAMALGDIGHHFPDNDPAFANADSRVLLRHVIEQVNDLGFCVSNSDVTVIAQAPKLADHIAGMKKNIADDLNVTIDNVNVKATTTEMLGFIGREEGIAVHAVVLLTEKASK
jgi:2-C-methyl-D-erythritol 2,4-cyclodiphosphate synthase